MLWKLINKNRIFFGHCNRVRRYVIIRWLTQQQVVTTFRCLFFVMRTKFAIGTCAMLIGHVELIGPNDTYTILAILIQSPQYGRIRIWLSHSRQLRCSILTYVDTLAFMQSNIASIFVHILSTFIELWTFNELFHVFSIKWTIHSQMTITCWASSSSIDDGLSMKHFSHARDFFSLPFSNLKIVTDTKWK